MCLGIPGKIIRKEKNNALVDFSGVKKDISLRVLSKAKVGDYVLVHSGLALAVIDEARAKESKKLIEEIFNEVK